MSAKVYSIIGGVNGCGKSSLTGVLQSQKVCNFLELGTIIDVDKLNVQYGNALEGGKAAIRLINDCLEKGTSFTQETTLSGVRTERTIRLAKEKGYTVRLYYVGLDSLEESLLRIQNRVANGGHNIPKHEVERRFRHRFEDLKRILPYCDEAAFYDNQNGFVQVAEYQQGVLVPLIEEPPRWIQDLGHYLEPSGFRSPLETWDPDFTKLTPEEAAVLRQSEQERENGEVFSENDIDWN